MTNNGLLKFPYSEHDWLVVTISLVASILKILLLYEDEDKEKPKIRDYLSILLISYITTIGLYEYAIYKGIPISKLYIPFAIIIILSKDLADWLFSSEEGKKYIINSFKVFIRKITKIDKEDK